MMLTLQEQFKVECRRLANDCDAKGIVWKPYIRGSPADYRSLAQCINTLHRLLRYNEIRQDLEDMEKIEAECYAIIQAADMAALGW